MNEPRRSMMTCPGCSEKVYLDQREGWRNDNGFTCKHGWGSHGEACMDKLGRAFHEAGAQVLKDVGMSKVVDLPLWADATPLQKMMVFSGVTAVLMEASR